MRCHVFVLNLAIAERGSVLLTMLLAMDAGPLLGVVSYCQPTSWLRVAGAGHSSCCQPTSWTAGVCSCQPTSWLKTGSFSEMPRSRFEVCHCRRGSVLLTMLLAS